LNSLPKLDIEFAPPVKRRSRRLDGWTHQDRPLRVEGVAPPAIDRRKPLRRGQVGYASRGRRKRTIDDA